MGTRFFSWRTIAIIDFQRGPSRYSVISEALTPKSPNQGGYIVTGGQTTPYPFSGQPVCGGDGSLHAFDWHRSTSTQYGKTKEYTDRRIFAPYLL